MTQHKALGRGLGALLGPAPAAQPANGERNDEVAKISVDKIRPNRFQPRTQFDPAALAELSESIKAHGLAQPLLVSPSAVPGEYELVAGERRLRASKMAGLSTVPCVIKTVSDRERHELSLIENLQRADLNALEEAQSLSRLMREFGLTQEDAANAVGRSRSAVANKLRLLDLPKSLQDALMSGEITEGHAKALLGISDLSRQAELGARILREKLTVRDVETLVADWSTLKKSGKLKTARRKNPDVVHLEESLQKILDRKVEIDVKAKSKGWLSLEFYSAEDLHKLTQHLKGKKKSQ
jgi:ParB family chromosome partitioning protein